MKNYLVLMLLAILVACTPYAPAMTEKDSLAASEPVMMEQNAAAEAMISKNDSSMMEKEQSSMLEKTAAPETMTQKEHTSMTKTEESMIKNDSMMNADSTSMEKESMSSPNLIGGDISKYFLWDSALFEKANTDRKIIYLEFSANWCPVCKQQEKDLIVGFETLDNPNVIGFKIPYKDSETTDEHTALARKYGIAYQHTKVILIDGKVALKSPEAWSADRFVTEVNKLG